MSRHQGSSSKGKSSGRGQQKEGANQAGRGGNTSHNKSYSRGNSPK